MVSKINPIILRVAIKNEWKLQFIEKKSVEHCLFIFQKNELVSFIYLFLYKNGLKINNLKMNYQKTFLHFFIDYSFIFKKNLFHFQSKFNPIHSKLVTNKVNTRFLNLLLLDRYFKNKYRVIVLKLLKFKFAKKLIFMNHKPRRLSLLKFIYFFKFKLKTTRQFHFINNFSNNLCLSLQAFLRYKPKICITVKQTIKNCSVKFFTRENKHKLFFAILKMHKFEKVNLFFIFYFKLILILINLQNKSVFIREFLNLLLSNYRNFKKLNFYFKFLTELLTQFLLKFNQIKGITIKLKGNINKSTRAVKKVVNIGQSMNNLTINNNIEYLQHRFFTLKGTIGCEIFIKY